MSTTQDELAHFEWQPQPAAAELVAEILVDCHDRLPALDTWRERLLKQTGTRLIDWVDHFAITGAQLSDSRLNEVGFQVSQEGGHTVWRHPAGLFPALLAADGPARVVLRVESLEDLAAANAALAIEIDGPAEAPYRQTRVAAADSCELWACERHGERGFEPRDGAAAQRERAAHWRGEFARRGRPFGDEATGFHQAAEQFAAAADELSVDWACDLFFAAERDYWQGRNRAAIVQHARQAALGLGWANHDHHTYRSSRRCFHELIAVFEQMGFVCRERFYAGSEAGWGAQVLEQPQAGIVIFADVDLSDDEVTEDFAHEPLAPRDEFGTVGMWCALHGESFLAAGMHHLECQFDFDAARRQLAGVGVRSMMPFTDFPHLKQAFTQGEIWTVRPGQIDSLLGEGRITQAEADGFHGNGALGSHLEILERNDGYLGFNQTGISSIIRKTDPRQNV
jgi:hypothetical protein